MCAAWCKLLKGNIVRHTPILKEYLPIIELSEQKYAWVYAEIRTPQPPQKNKNKNKKTVKTTRYNWSLFVNCDIKNKYTITARDRLDTLQDISKRHSTQAESLLHSLEQGTRGSCFYVNFNKTEFMCFKHEGVISILSVRAQK